MITLSFDGSDQRVLESMRAKGPQIVQAVIRKMDQLMLVLQAKVVGEKLQGQVLKHKTGKLAGSIRKMETIEENGAIVGIVQGGGGPAWYGALHETGGTFEVPEYQRRTGISAKGEVVKLLSKSGAVQKNVARIRSGTVKAHTVTFPERSFMRSSLNEFRGQLFDGLRASVNAEISK
jgi:hypothetical protein